MKTKKYKKFVVYKITNINSGKSYIGITVDYKRRMKQHFNSNKYENSYLHRAIKKYSKKQFKYKIIYECNSWEELCKKEIECIKFLNTKIPNGYNLTDGGEGNLGWTPSKETRKKIGNGNKGKKHSKEHKKKISEACKNPSAETRKKLSEIHKGKVLSAEICKARSEARKIFSKDQILEIKQLLLNRVSQCKIAKKFNVVTSTIGRIKRNECYENIQLQNTDLSLLPKGGCKFTDSQILEIKQLLSNGIIYSRIAKKFGVAQETIGLIKRDQIYANIQIPNVDLSLLSKYNRKFTKNQILKIRQMLNDGIFQKTIAKKFDVSLDTVSRIKRNESYSEIQLPKRG